jgi:N-acetyl-1-D-myo-inositol-2-amino-2-deoxy-alpha-D-glucopyranoside deacetylase
MAELGVTDWRLLGGPGRFRDSGMVGTPPNDRPDCFWRTDLLVAATELVPVIREVRPQVVVTYDDFGGYGHPDHIQAHRVTHYAIALAASPTYRSDLGPAWEVQKVYWTAFPRSIVRAGIEALRAQGVDDEFTAMDPDDIPFACDDALVTTEIEAGEFLDRKMAALRAHKTQVSVDGGFFALADNVGSEAFGTEYYRLAQGPLVVATGAEKETDLFAGIEG